MQELLDRGAQTEFPVGQAKLHTAIQVPARAGQAEVAKFLLPTVSDIDFSASESPSALYLAALSGSYETFKLLVDHGANVHLLSFDGFSHACCQPPGHCSPSLENGCSCRYFKLRRLQNTPKWRYHTVVEGLH
ncbi:hypothetical protein VHEMI01618 [[Torrubiella] hemipterigena]|uniref:Uncharacterized protein n=1 Tax=[Torrubiella] hemipterigena TaxID=1531966 RepID=A0A0A1STJ6_9HYPO|nr:hypothetical protein VHEMI01618 [[Torrubiella] hemipterigena]